MGHSTELVQTAVPTQKTNLKTFHNANLTWLLWSCNYLLKPKMMFKISVCWIYIKQNSPLLCFIGIGIYSFQAGLSLPFTWVICRYMAVHLIMSKYTKQNGKQHYKTESDITLPEREWGEENVLNPNPISHIHWKKKKITSCNNSYWL